MNTIPGHVLCNFEHLVNGWPVIHDACTMLFCRVSVLEKEDLKHIVDIVTNAKLVVSSIQDVARKLGDFAKIGSTSTNSGEFD